MSRKNQRKPLTISKQAKGFPIKLSNEHLYNMHLIYPWLREQGLTDEDTDEALSLFPPFALPRGEMEAAHKLGYIPAMCHRDSTSNWTVSQFCKTKTHRVRAGNLAQVAKLFRLCGAFISQGQMGRTLVKRAEDMESVSILDQLYDAQRGDDEKATLSLRD